MLTFVLRGRPCFRSFTVKRLTKTKVHMRMRCESLIPSPEQLHFRLDSLR